MASHSQITRVLTTLFALIPLLMFQSHVSSQDKVNLSLYYESLCPYCADFIVNQLVKVLQTDLGSIVNLRLVPWGNTQIAPNTSWICQHGTDECQLNTVEACAIKVWSNLETHFKFISCIEGLHLQNKHSSWQSCFASTGLDESPIESCYNNGLGYRLETAYADETAHLNPAHKFVPWVLVNNQPLREMSFILVWLHQQCDLKDFESFGLRENLSNDTNVMLSLDYQNFIAYICSAYKGRNIPQACKIKSLEINKTNAQDTSPGICFRV